MSRITINDLNLTDSHLIDLSQKDLNSIFGSRWVLVGGMCTPNGYVEVYEWVPDKCEP